LGYDMIGLPDPNLSPRFEGFPTERRADLDAFLLTLPESERAALENLWPRLAALIERVQSRLPDPSSSRVFADWTRDVLMQLLTSDRNWFRRIREAGVQEAVERAHQLLELYAGRPVPKLVVRLFDAPKQRMGLHPEQDVPIANLVEARFRSFLAECGAVRPTESESIEVQVGASMLALILDCGVLSRRELKAAIAMLYSGEQIRGARGSYYLSLTLGQGDGTTAAETRRMFLTPLAVSAAIVIKPLSEPPPNLRTAFRAILGRMGITGNGAPSLKKLLSGVAVLMRFSGPIPQFVVDFCEGRVSTHAMSESTWRRALNLAPWKQEDPPQPGTAAERVADDTGETRRSCRQDGSLLSRVMFGLSSATSTAEAAELLQSLKVGADDMGAERLMLAWAVALTREVCSTGKVRRVGTIRNMLTACGPRLIALVGDNVVSATGVDDWRGLVEQIADESLSSSRRTTIYSALHHFLNWMVMTGRLSEIPVDVPTARPGSAVNPTLVTPREFRELLQRLDDEVSSESDVDRRYQKLIALLGYDVGLRRGETRGLLVDEIDSIAPMFVEIEPNRIRALKTDSSARRSPLGLQTQHDLKPLIKEACRAPAADGRLVPADRISVDEETLLRRLSALLRDICGDADVSIHSLRHSAATWILLCLYADVLQLGRFREQWPFVAELLEIAADVRRILFGNKSSLHGLHIVRQMLGHRHESMSLTHYIHAMDLMRFAAATLRVGDSALDHCIGVARLAEPAMTRSSDVPVFLKKMVRRHSDRVMVDDTPRAPVLAQKLREATQDREVFERWRQMSGRCAIQLESVSENARAWHQRVVGVINRRGVVNRAKNSKSGLSVLDDIRPLTTADKAHAQTFAAWIESEGGHDPGLGAAIEKILEAHVTRNQGWFSVVSRKSACSLEVMEQVAPRLGARVERAIERKKRKGRGNARRTFDPVRSMEAALEMGRRSVFARFVPVEGSQELAPCSHRALIWCLAMAGAPTE
jgi:integrase